MELVSILLASYNGEKYIAEQLDSILNQTYQNFKIFISDDVSNDNTLEIIKKYEEKYPNKIKIINSTRRNGSATSNFSYLFKNVNEGDYFMFCDQDDYWLPNKIEIMLSKIKEMKKLGLKNNLVYSDAYVVDKGLNIISNSFYDYAKLNYSGKKSKLMITNDVPGAAMLFDSDLKKRSGLIPKECYVHDFWLMLNATFFGNVAFINQSLYKYRQHGNNVAGSGVEMSFIGLLTLIKKKNIFSLYKNVKELYRKQAILQRNTIQEFYKINETYIDEDDTLMINYYFKLFSKDNKLKKIFYIFKFKFFHNTKFRTMVFMITMK